LPKLKLVADLGLVLYSFLTGMEFNLNDLSKPFKKSWAISIAGLFVPFCLGISISKILYQEYADENLSYLCFMLFCGVIICFTAYPVLARLLTSRKLMNINVGPYVLAAAALNDGVAW
jgi:Kef-type K+ transport system membrane component KefB